MVLGLFKLGESNWGNQISDPNLATADLGEASGDVMVMTAMHLIDATQAMVGVATEMMLMAVGKFNIHKVATDQFGIVPITVRFV